MEKQPLFLDDIAFHRLVDEIARKLDGLAVSQADHVLKAASKLLYLTARFEVTSEAYRQRMELEQPSTGSGPLN